MNLLTLSGKYICHLFTRVSFPHSAATNSPTEVIQAVGNKRETQGKIQTSEVRKVSCGVWYRVIRLDPKYPFLLPVLQRRK
jgi:hypothetical protein